jgi:hypothetical protein
MENIESICCSEGMYFRDEVLGNYYCKLSYSGKKIECKFFGKKDENNLNVCCYKEFKKLEEEHLFN